jgi:hypothetical protein
VYTENHAKPINTKCIFGVVKADGTCGYHSVLKSLAHLKTSQNGLSKTRLGSSK